MTQRVIILLSLIALVTQAAWAGHVSEQQAKAEAQTFLQQKSGAVKSLKVAAKAPRMQSAVADNAFYYVFNIGDNGGFIVVSGDDRTTPILGYADEGAFDPKHVPTNMQAWLDEYEAQLKALDAMSDAEAQAAIAAPRKARTVDTRNSISPMITTKWNQASPYWNECPEFMDIDAYGDTVGEFAYTGCVATSMAKS